MRFDIEVIYGALRIHDRRERTHSTWMVTVRSADAIAEHLNLLDARGDETRLESAKAPYYFKDRSDSYNVPMEYTG